MNLPSTQDIEITCLKGKSRIKIKDKVIREIPLTIFLNSTQVGCLLCTPSKVDCLAVGFLFTQGMIQKTEKIKDIYFNPVKSFIQVKMDKPGKDIKKISLSKNLHLSSCGVCSFYPSEQSDNSERINSSFKIERKLLFEVMEEFEKKSSLFKTTGGNHSAALYNREKLEVFAEDIGRHNAVDKVLGECFLREIETEERLLLVSGRISWEILTKAFKGSIPVLASPSAPTNLAVSLADRLNITVIGFLRGKRMNIYTHPWRVI